MTDAPVEKDVGIEPVLESLGLRTAEVVSTETRATDTRVWRVIHEGRSLAVRMFREEQRDVMRAELAALAHTNQVGIPVPNVVAHGMVDGRFPAMAIDWVPGEIIGETLMKHPRLGHRVGWNAGIVLARLHDTTFNRAELSAAIGQDWISLGTTAGSELRDVLERVAGPESSLLHLDFHPFNLLSTGGRITGIIDWTNTMIGDPRADIARTVSILRLIAPALVARRGAHRMVIGRFTRGLLAGYAARRGPPQEMAPFFTWAGQMMLRDMGPKLDWLPNPALVRRRIEEWNDRWRNKALATYVTG